MISKFTRFKLGHFGMSNQDRTYTVNGRFLESATQQKDQGIQMLGSLKVEGLMDSAKKRAFGLLFLHREVD